MSGHDCNYCDQKQLLESFEALNTCAKASRDTGCCVPFGTDDDRILTRSERAGYWLGVGATVGLSVVAVFGTAGYLLTKLV